MKYVLNNGAGGGGARLGLIVLATDETLEFEARQLLAGREIQLLHARIPVARDITPASLGAMDAAMPVAAALLPEGLDVIGYACTSGATVIGQARVAAQVQSVHPQTRVTDPISAVIAALGHVGAARIAMLTPYVPSVTAPMRALLAANGIETMHEASFAEGDDRKVARIDPASTRAALLEAAKTPGVEALFASCTNLQTFSIIDDVEAETGLPVITSNQALLWHMQVLAADGASAEIAAAGPGRLFTV
ncbi:maleate isomerase [Roseovarius nanhaiticus]|uniref:Maleate isomerase n=1 Tax=Roseovarius nanhaiticus TaxID=573024 RepID=A0A1N7HFG0_9RHOB|nr:aspartate/glutamate racemase family protein [Roseovarius nanhaiticus]SEK97894.1 maleate isomerase [Roseovarius nanhaiticus]SIS23599.1 maleate isomerase [Roseovarius nanhaiticus]